MQPSSGATGVPAVTGQVKERWLVLFIYCVLSFSNAMNWTTFSPIAGITQDKYDIGDFQFTSLSLIFMALYPPFGLISAWVLERYGLRQSLMIAGALNGLGAGIRCIGYGPSGFYWVFAGQTLASMGQGFILGMPPVLANAWFGEQQRSTATAIASLANQLGCGVGFIIPPFIVKEEADMWKLLVVEGAFSCSVIPMIFFFVKSKPPIPPSLSSYVVRMGFGASFKKLFTDFRFLMIMLCVGIGIGIFFAIGTVLGLLLDPSGYSESTIGIFGLIMIMAGVLGAFLEGIVADRWMGNLKTILVITSLGACASLSSFSALSKQYDVWLMGTVCILFGFFVTALVPAGFELSVEETYPVPESISSIVIVSAANIFGLLITIALDVCVEMEIDLRDASWCLTVLQALAVAVIVPVKVFYKRLQVDMVRHQSDITRSSSKSQKLDSIGPKTDEKLESNPTKTDEK